MHTFFEYNPLWTCSVTVMNCFLLSWCAEQRDLGLRVAMFRVSWGLNKTKCLLCSSWSTWRSNQPSGIRSLESCRCYMNVTPPTLWASTGLSTVTEKSASAWSIWYRPLIFYAFHCVLSAVFTLIAALQTAQSLLLSVNNFTFAKPRLSVLSFINPVLTLFIITCLADCRMEAPWISRWRRRARSQSRSSAKSASLWVPPAPLPPVYGGHTTGLFSRAIYLLLSHSYKSEATFVIYRSLKDSPTWERNTRSCTEVCHHFIHRNTFFF